MSTQERTGDILIISHSILWGLFPVVTALSYTSLSPLTSLFFSSFLSAVFFLVWTLVKGTWKEILHSDSWLDLLYIILTLGVVYYALYFTGIQYTTPGNASLVALLETFFSFLLFNVWQKEYFSVRNILGALLMVAGAAVVLSPGAGGLHKGDIFIIVAVAIAPIGNYFQRRVRARMSSEVMLFIRCLGTLPFLYFLIRLSGQALVLDGLRTAWVFVVANGFVLFGFTKILWLEGIHRISVTKAASLSALAPVATLVFSFLFLHLEPTVPQSLSFIPFSLGLYLLTFQS